MEGSPPSSIHRNRIHPIPLHQTVDHRGMKPQSCTNQTTHNDPRAELAGQEIDHGGVTTRGRLF